MGVVRNNPESIMSKSRTAAATTTTTPGRLSPRRIWPSRSKSQSRLTSNPAAWTPQGDCLWTSRNGRHVTLVDSHLTLLTDAERAALRQLALAKLQALNIGCHITVPKGDRIHDLKPKKRPILLKKRAVTTGFFAEKKAGKNVEERVARGMVFGVPLGACVYHERRKALGGMSTPRSKSTSVEDLMTKGTLPRSASRSSFTLILDPRDDKRFLGRQEAQSYESLNLELVKRRSLLGLSEPFALDASSTDGEVFAGPYVPEVVQMCFRHIETYGLHTLGIFRVSSSRKRVRQLREEFDSGRPVDLGAQQCPHDVATLLKEYFRDLPEPLLTRELYPAYVASQKVRNRKHLITILRHLTQLLPTPNGDTLATLLQFLANVAINANDHRNAIGEWVAGNKMDSNNLATLFGPNVLHTVKNTTGGEREFVVLTAARADERIDVINALRCMIDNYKDLFHVSAEYLDEAYRLIYEKDPDSVEYLLKIRLNSSELNIDFDTSSSLPEGLDTPTTCITISTSDVDIVSMPVPNRRRREDKNKGSKADSLSPPLTSRFFRRPDKSSPHSTEGEPLPSSPSSPPLCGTEGGKRLRKRITGEEESAPSRWFRRRERNTTKNLDAAIDAVHSQQDAATNERKAREKSSPSRVRPLTVEAESNSSEQRQRRSSGSGRGIHEQEVSVVNIRKEHLVVPEDHPTRRLSYPVDTDGNVISASLTLKVPSNKKAHASTLGAVALRMDDRDIPYIEDLGPDQDLESGIRRLSSGGQHPSSYSERRHRSSPFLASSSSSDPLPDLVPSSRGLRRKPHRSQDSVLSSEGTSSISSPRDSLRHTASSDLGCASSHSGASTPLSTWSTPSSPRHSPPPMTANKRVASPQQQDTWKRWEIISSEHTEQETLV